MATAIMSARFNREDVIPTAEEEEKEEEEEEEEKKKNNNKGIKR